MKTHTRFAISLLVAVSILTANLVTVHAIELRYAGVIHLNSSLTISARGAATCSGSVSLMSGYTADITVELKRDGTTIKTWTDSGSRTVSADGTYYVTSGHDYVVTTTATVYDSNGKIVETPSKDSTKVSY